MTETPKLEVIRKLLAKAEGAATPEEATAYNAKAAEMMARHGVDSAMLAATGARQDRITELRIAMTDPYSTEKSQLASWVGAAVGCRAIRYQGFRRGSIESVTLFGFESDLQRADMLFTSLLLQATREVVRQRPPTWSGESTAAFRRTWLVGFAGEIHRRLSSAERKAAEEHAAGPSQGASVALVLVNRHKAVDDEFLRQHPGLRKSRRRQLSGSGFASGTEAGRRADLGGRRLRGERWQLDR